MLNIEKYYQCYICEKSKLTEEEILENDDKISNINEEIYGKLIDKLNLIDISTTDGVNSINGIPAICDKCIQDALSSIFIDKYGKTIFIGSNEVEIKDGKLILININDDIFFNGKIITEDFVKYFDI